MEGLPPETIHVKRKRGTDEDPVDFLRLDRSKRYRSLSGDISWVYRRKQTETEPPDPAARPAVPEAPTVPSIQPTREGDERRLLGQTRKVTQVQAASNVVGTQLRASAPPELPAPSVLTRATPDQLRRFHLSRSNSPQPAAGVAKKRSAPAVFVERSAKKRGESLKAVIEEHNAALAGSTQAPDDSRATKSPKPASQQFGNTAKQPGSTQNKRPGVKARIKQSTGSKPSLPPSMRREGVNMEELSRVMDSWTLNEINKNIDKMEEIEKKSKSSPVMSRFRPKAPKQRYFERHPEHRGEQGLEKGARQAAAAAVMDIDSEYTTDDDDYVIETYERVPAERLRDEVVPAHRVGLLVFDTEPDMVEFYYGNENDSEEEFLEDEEDEDAENHYTTEYPDEDLPWDDEFDRGAYHYLTRNASDLEEFDERDFVDDLDDTDFINDILERSDNADGLPG